MSEFITQTAKLVPYAKRPKQASGFVTAYVYEPLAGELGSDLGNLYVVIEALVSGRASEELVDLIIETVGNAYYNRHNDTSGPEERFEGAVKAVNIELAEHVNRGNAAWIGKLSSVIALQSANELHLSHTGSAEAFLYRGKTASRITTGASSRPLTPSKTFSSIASGQLEIGDRLLLATPALIHQLSLARLQTAISENNPNTAIGELTALLRKDSTDRIACLIIEVTTPELAALRVRSDAPSEIQLGMPETPIEAAKIAAAPLAQSTAKSSKHLLSVANKSLARNRRHAQKLGLALAEQIRQLLSSRHGRRTAGILALFVVLLLAFFIWHTQTTGRNARLLSGYQTAYYDYQQASSQLAAGNSDQSQTSANQAKKELDALRADETTIDRQLAADHKLRVGEPTSYSALDQQLADLLQQLGGYSRVNPTTISTLPSISARPSFLEISNGTAYIVDTSEQKIYLVNLKTSSTTTAGVNLKGLGVVKATTLSPNGDGMYLLTDTPSVWFYNFQTATLAKQSIAYDQWPNGGAISAYLNNLYILSTGEVYKYVKNQTGFSPGIAYLKTSSDSDTNALAVDGSIYIVDAGHIKRFSGGATINDVALPSNLASLANLRSAAGGTALTAVGIKSNRVGLWSVGPTTLKLHQDAELQGVKIAYDLAYDATTGTVYASVDHRLVKFNF